MTTKLGAAIRKYRDRLQLSQEELGERIGKRQHYVSQVERGQIKRPSDANLERLVNALGITRATLFAEAGWIDAPEDVDDPEPEGPPISEARQRYIGNGLYYSEWMIEELNRRADELLAEERRRDGSDEE